MDAYQQNFTVLDWYAAHARYVDIRLARDSFVSLLTYISYFYFAAKPSASK